MDRYIKKMEDDGHTPLQMVPMMHVVNDMVEECANEDNSDNERTSGSEWDIQMEERTKPVVHVITDKPPSKPPPSLEQNISYHIDEAQWIADIQTAADTSLNNRDIQHAACLCPHDYIPSVKKLSQNNAINKHHLSIKRQQLQHHHRRDPIKCTLITLLTYLHIPIPK